MKSSGTTCKLFMLALLAVGCGDIKSPQVKTSAVTKPVVAETVERADNWASPSGFDLSSINLIIRDSKINFVSSNARQVRELLGNPERTTSLMGTEDGWIDQDTYDGIAVDYYRQSGKLNSVVITSPKFAVENGGKVGDSWQEVLRKYPGGFSFPGQLEKAYRYAVITQSNYGPWGQGFTFFFDRAQKVERIEIGLISFGP